MPNWCTNSVVVYGNKSEIEIFRQKYEQAFKQMQENKNWGTYELFMVHGYEHNFTLSDKSDWIRGQLYEPNGTGTLPDGTCYFSFYFESAWGPMIDGLNRILKDNYKTLKSVILAEEFGNGIFVNTDTEHKFFDEKYCIDSDELGMEYFSNDHDLIEYIKNELGIYIESVDKLTEEDSIELPNNHWFNFFRYTAE